MKIAICCYSHTNHNIMISVWKVLWVRSCSRNDILTAFKRKPAFCICKNKDADQLISAFVFATYIDVLPKSEISSIRPSSVVVQSDLCRTWSETAKTGFLTTRLILQIFLLLEVLWPVIIFVVIALVRRGVPPVPSESCKFIFSLFHSGYT